MAHEARRGCGYRKVGGLYVVSGKLSAPCGRLPLELSICPTCHGGIHQARGWTWINPAKLLARAARCVYGREEREGETDLQYCKGCPASPTGLAHMGERAGLLWVGGKFYPEAKDFMDEAREMGVSRRISALPRGFEVGNQWVLIAHPRAVYRPLTSDEVLERETTEVMDMPKDDFGMPMDYFPGVITLFRPTAIEKIVTETQSQDGEEMAKLAKRGITPVVVPDDDPDHQGTVYDKSQQEMDV